MGAIPHNENKKDGGREMPGVLETLGNSRDSGEALLQTDNPMVMGALSTGRWDRDTTGTQGENQGRNWQFLLIF